MSMDSEGNVVGDELPLDQWKTSFPVIILENEDNSNEGQLINAHDSANNETATSAGSNDKNAFATSLTPLGSLNNSSEENNFGVRNEDQSNISFLFDYLNHEAEPTGNTSDEFITPDLSPREMKTSAFTKSLNAVTNETGSTGTSDEFITPDLSPREMKTSAFTKSLNAVTNETGSTCGTSDENTNEVGSNAASDEYFTPCQSPDEITILEYATKHQFEMVYPDLNRENLELGVLPSIPGESQGPNESGNVTLPEAEMLKCQTKPDEIALNMEEVETVHEDKETEVPVIDVILSTNFDNTVSTESEEVEKLALDETSGNSTIEKEQLMFETEDTKSSSNHAENKLKISNSPGQDAQHAAASSKVRDNTQTANLVEHDDVNPDLKSQKTQTTNVYSIDTIPISPVGQIFVLRDYSRGLTLTEKFEDAYPDELFGFIHQKQWETTINGINQILHESDQANCCTCWENILDILTCYLIRCCYKKRKERYWRKLVRFIRSENSRVYEPRRIKIRNPILNGFRHIEISFLDNEFRDFQSRADIESMRTKKSEKIFGKDTFLHLIRDT